MVLGAVLLVPKGILDASVLRLFGKPAFAGLVMAGVGLVVARYDARLGAIVATLSYVGTLWLTGALRGEELRSLLASVNGRPA